MRISFRIAAGGLFTLALISPIVSSSAQPIPNAPSIVVVGAGYTDTWLTQVDFSNPSDSNLTIDLQAPFQLTCPAPVLCESGVTTLDLAPHASATLYASESGAVTIPAMGTLNVVTTDAGQGAAVSPSIRCRVINAAHPSQAIELPAYGYSQISALAPTVLSFAGASRSEATHSNLVIANLWNPTVRPDPQAPPITVRVDALDAQGNVVGSEAFQIDPNSSIFLQDILGYLGASVISGQILVTQTAGNGLVWGLMSTLGDDGSVAVSAGAYP